MIGIYCFTNIVNGKKYIGQSINIDKRIRNHIKKGSNAHFDSAIKKYGIENFSISVLKELSDSKLVKILLDVYERHYIALYDTTNRLNGYNKDSGGSNGIPNEETRYKLSISHMGNKGFWTGKKRPAWSDEYKKKMSLQKKGLPSKLKGIPWSIARREACNRGMKRNLIQ